MATIFKLIIEDDEGKTTVYPLADGEIAIGRRDGNTIRLMERNVSRRHAKLSRTNGAVFIEDLDSYNGIRINGERISGKYEVKEGDLVEIGDYHLALQRTEMQEDAPPPAADGPRDGQWPQAGTVPDFRLPEEILQDVKHYDRAPRDTLHDEPIESIGAASLLKPSTSETGDPMVRPPPRGNDDGPHDLPPFPTPGGSPLGKIPMSAPAAGEEPTEPPPEKPLAIGPARMSTVPRLVCVSTSYAGKEFALTRPELIIGRVEDNDIVIEHRSVSRNHAKILSANSAHKIIDLQSANGILVNGEEYAMTDLRKGDLIELGHVRFRFIPANEAFVPNEEEASEMRTAGVEPPSQQAPPELSSPVVNPPPPAHVGAFDPSTAATVTDTPLDALNMGQAFAPAIESRTVPAATEPPVKRATDDQRPTEINRVSRSAPTAPLSSPAAVPVVRSDSIEPNTRQEQIVDPMAPPKGKSGLMIAVALLVVAALGLAVVMLMMRQTSHDDQLQALFSQKKWSEARTYYERHRRDFKQPLVADTLYQQALAASGNEPEVETPPHEEDPEPIPVPPPPKETPSKAIAAPPPPKKVRRAAPPPPPRKPRRPRVDSQSAFDAGSRALVFGDLTVAEKHLKRCLVADKNFARCHRALGVLYARRDETKLALKHYRKYIEIAPNANDAERVREMIKAASTPQ